MFMQGSWAYGSIMERNPQLNLELIPFPVDSGQEQFVTMWIDGGVISGTANIPREAEKFVEFLMKPEILQLYLDAGILYLAVWREIKNRAEYAPRVHQLIREGRAVMDASWLPLQTSVIRDKDILSLMPDAGRSGRSSSYFDTYSKSLQKHKDLYLEAKEKRE